MNLSISNPRAIRISGEAGQGNILMGMVLAQALVKEGYWVVQTQHYGAQVRGGLSYCDVLYDEEPIDYPKADIFNIIYIMHDLGVEHIEFLKKNGIVFYDDEFVKKMPQTVNRTTKKIIKVSASKIAYKEIGSLNVANMVGLGILSKVTDIISLDTLIATMKENVKSSYHEMDEKALRLGYESLDKKYKIKTDNVITRLGRGYE
ncbi:2-oxoacid:acceptor oxidoreductase family protein [Geotoga petraea]|jgi:2-oxoglutarate ferredoxin oxidoreductase subunit gamma|uniref:2-oxoglutarate ferredoxin oxidoreductase, gamma subunit n=1 Tax=Geotoga petraea TaxID=28234 RepID=A0A1G6MVN7_9BACT|nr:2-oxoacid:acceptor oxidoreductase family protein [Geotoga petraea]MDK2946228.1 2-oxoglutarate ferredoxin oxidoreductase subunit gamma [Geotoga sp.]TGG87324.1 pyruvate ferredoxin oxidoreductase [Geotoga petraea]SDC59599.1 2-oxoglutarate ferredoxin oxidoreductase, gamma subunit [Geotoga petraea]